LNYTDANMFLTAYGLGRETITYPELHLENIFLEAYIRVS